MTDVPVDTASVVTMMATTTLDSSPTPDPTTTRAEHVPPAASPELAPPPVIVESKDEEPLYTEIQIPLPPIPQPKRTQTSTSKSRPRAHTLHSLSPFHRRSSSGSRKEEEQWPRIKKEVKSKEIAAAMNLTNRHKRSGTVDALAVVPAVLILSAELFTPVNPGKKQKGMKRWEDGMI
ncbi:hypothetical protein BS50DRAFT_246855 [Corynespora cassiicola Philippines]|uniref:Uncharacterized protein n=1 Tax=Corynespora cassiicola Philippines TaxID=1448308 RepID=A0A2T2P3I9_CORCC|nr:hypothetical protein BS50DRAFT_246855 [Corynespora cassiicola Philippines]